MKKIYTFLLSLTLFVLLSGAASAQLLNDTNNLKTMTDTTAATAHFSDISVENIIATIIKIILGFLGVIFIILMLTAGFKWMTAQGNEEHITEAQKTIQTAIIGLIIVMGAYAITYFVFKYIPFSGTGAENMPKPQMP